MQKPTLQASHFIDRDHEAAVAARDPSPGCIGKQEGIPAGPMGRSQQHGTLHRQVLPAQHLHAREKRWQSEIFGDHDRQGRQPGADAVAQACFPGGQRTWGRGGGQEGRVRAGFGLEGSVIGSSLLLPNLGKRGQHLDPFRGGTVLKLGAVAP